MILCCTTKHENYWYGYEATHDAEGIGKAYSVSKWTVYRLVAQKRKTGSVALRTS